MNAEKNNLKKASRGVTKLKRVNMTEPKKKTNVKV